MEDDRERRWIDPATGLRIMTLVEGVCRHPRWYTLNGTFAEAVAFLNGYYFALGNCKGKEEQKRFAEWDGFCLWMAEKLEVVHPERMGEIRPTIYFFDRIRDDCCDDPTALARLLDWWFEYWSSCQR